MPADLTIQLEKKLDGSFSLRCRRADGSVTWGKYGGRQGAFFPFHDLTHFAVETVLGHRRGFYGLLAEGWAITDFGKPWPRGPIPVDAEPAELIVGLLDSERVAGEAWSTAAFNRHIAGFYEQHGVATSPLVLREEQLEAIRARCRELYERWDKLPAGGVMELQFTSAAATAR